MTRMPFSGARAASPGWTYLLPLLAPPLLVVAAKIAEAQENPEPQQLPPVVVTPPAPPPSLTIPDRAQAREELRKVPGNTRLIGREEFRNERVGSLEDVLENAPGVYIESRFGGSETRFSIRGSGITQTFESRGVRLLRNGLPLTEADGFTRSQLVDPLIIQRAEVFSRRQCT